ncbi:zinc finger protein [Anopheles sinensis]|uniref:Zinc finger protein n=1 Tax=Anopheles sinensis TaxID=74873 RepID=A0A084WQD6_ANOSI|nr:zinc finger protein [Anopheles sinensis]
MIKFCAGVQITEEDDLPRYVCTKCSEETTFAYMFVNKCRKSDAELRTQQILGPREEDISGEQIECLKSVVQSEVQSDGVGETGQLGVECYDFELLDDTVDGASLHSWHDHSRDDEATETNNEVEPEEWVILEEEVLCESEGEETKLPSNGLDEGGTKQHDKCTDRIDYLDQSDDSIYFCCNTDCTATFTSKPKLIEHFQSLHAAENDSESEYAIEPSCYRCANCGQSFRSVDELKRHENRLHLKRAALCRRQFGRPKLYPSIFDASEKICCGCFERFATTEELLAHSETTHAIRKTAIDPDRPAQCQICYKLFRSESHVRTHLISVYKSRKFRCTDCDARYTTASKLAHHRLVQHAGPGKYVCGECGASLKSEHNLKMHSLLHREKREVCKTCGLRFHRKSNLKVHQRIHADTFYYACTHCPKQMKTMSQLKEHVKVHTKEKPYPCRFCDKRFRYCTDRTRHEMVHTGNYPFECSGCSKKFARSFSYYRHRNKCGASNEAPFSRTAALDDDT